MEIKSEWRKGQSVEKEEKKDEQTIYRLIGRNIRIKKRREQSRKVEK